MGFTVSTHFCGGHAVESVLAIGNQDVDCGMMDMKQEHANHQDGKAHVSKAPCCANDYTVYEIADDYSAEANTISVDNNFLFALVYTSLFANFESGDNNKPYTFYDSPPLIEDIPVFNQSFLI